MSSNPEQGGGTLTLAAARRLEYGIIGLGVLALLMIFQPFNITLFAIGCMLVVLAALMNNLLPLSQPGVPVRSVARAALIVALIFCVALLVAIFAAYLYGVFFLRPPDPDTVAGRAQLNARPWYMHGFTWSVAIVACVVASLLALQGRRRT